jgi:hypothetical protein
MGIEDDPNHPLWNTFEQPQKDLWIVFYKGNSGRWIASSPCYYEENAERMAANFDRPTRILHYKLNNENYVDTKALRSKYEKKIKIKQPKVRQPLRIRKPIGE